MEPQLNEVPIKRLGKSVRYIEHLDSTNCTTVIAVMLSVCVCVCVCVCVFVCCFQHAGSVFCFVLFFSFFSGSIQPRIN